MVWREVISTSLIKGSSTKKDSLAGVFRAGAFNQNRTDDLILTMDALYRLSYKGVFFFGAGDGNRTHAVSLGS